MKKFRVKYTVFTKSGRMTFSYKYNEVVEAETESEAVNKIREGCKQHWKRFKVVVRDVTEIQ